MPLRHWLQLSLTRGLGPVLIRRLIDHLHSAEAACDASVNVLRSIDGVGLVKGDGIYRAMKAAAGQVTKELDRAEKLGVRIICREDDGYPVLLRDIYDPPAVLYVRGTVEDRDLNGIAIVGSRKCSLYGREQAERFAALLAGAGFTINSGGARGIDSAAHRGAMTHLYGRTIAVLGSGVDVPYPPENKGLFDEIVSSGKGAVMSEYPFGTPPLADNFPRRNRIVSGMSRGVLVIEADERSGALITARQAVEDHSRPVFAVPGRVDNPLSAGPHKLLREGAMLAAKIEDIIENLDPLPHDVVTGSGMKDVDQEADEEDASADPATPAGGLFDIKENLVAAKLSTPVPNLSDRQREIVDAMSGDSATVDALVERTGLPAHVILQELTFMSLRGAVKRVDGQTYAPRGK